MGKILDFGKTNGLDLVALLFNSESCTPFQMKKNISIKEVWDGSNLRLTFRRTVNQSLMNQWYELLNICIGINLTSERDAIICHINGN
jgi:hypothetical protein